MIKKFNQFINENDSYINWESIEERFVKMKSLPDCIPANIREWDTFIKQYERALEIANGSYELPDWNTEEDFDAMVKKHVWLDKGFKKSFYECLEDINYNIEIWNNLFPELNYEPLFTAVRFTSWAIRPEHFPLSIKKTGKLPKLPIKIGGDFNISDLNLITLIGCPEYVGGNFYCIDNNLKNLYGAPKHVGYSVSTIGNPLETLEGTLEWVGSTFIAGYQNDKNRKEKFTTLKGVPHVEGFFYWKGNTELGIPPRIDGKLLSKYIDL